MRLNVCASVPTSSCDLSSAFAARLPDPICSATEVKFSIGFECNPPTMSAKTPVAISTPIAASTMPCVVAVIGWLASSKSWWITIVQPSLWITSPSRPNLNEATGDLLTRLGEPLYSKRAYAPLIDEISEIAWVSKVPRFTPISFVKNWLFGNTKTACPVCPNWPAERRPVNSLMFTVARNTPTKSERLWAGIGSAISIA